MQFNEPWNHASSNIGLACREGNYDAVKYLLCQGKSVDDRDNRGWTPVHEAAANNEVRCLQLILEQREIDINSRSYEGETPLMLAVRMGHEEAVELLLAKKADPNAANNEEESPLMFAVKLQKLSCVRNLLDRGANVNHQSYDGSTPLHYAIERQCSKSIVEVLIARGSNVELQDCNKFTPVFNAARYGHLAVLKVLLEHAREIGCLQTLINTWAEDGATPLIIATQSGFDQCVDVLLQNGADCNKMTFDHASALHLAAQFGHFNCAKLLLDKMDETIWTAFHYNNANRDIFDNAVGSPLHASIFWQRRDITKLILKTGINPNDVFASTKCYILPNISLVRSTSTTSLVLPLLMPPLAVAALKGCIADIITLLDAGAQINPPQNGVMCPLLVAVIRGRMDVIEFLLSNGANPNFSRAYSDKFNFLLVVPGLKANILRLLLKHGADARSAIDNHDANNCIVSIMCEFSLLEESHNTIAVLQEFLSPAMLENHLVKVFNQVPNFNEYTRRCWTKIFETARTPPSLLHLCRLKVRQCLIDNGSNEYPFAKRLEKLSRLPDIIARYLAYA